MAIAASMLQYTGTSQGVFFDPPTLASGSVNAMLSWTPAFQAALGLYVNLTSLAPPFSPTASCSNDAAMVDLFRQGRCAFIMGSRVFKVRAGSRTGAVKGGLARDDLSCCAVLEPRLHCPCASCALIKQGLLGNDSFVRGKLGVAQLPGSPVVFDRAGNRTVTCTSQTCPFAVQAPVRPRVTRHATGLCCVG